MFKAQVLVGPSKQLRQIIEIVHNIVKNPNWQEADRPVGNLQVWSRIELGATEKRKPNFDLWLCIVGCSVYDYILENPHSCKDTKMPSPPA